MKFVPNDNLMNGLLTCDAKNSFILQPKTQVDKILFLQMTRHNVTSVKDAAATNDELSGQVIKVVGIVLQ
jgi:hypothetical protein